MIDVQNNKLQTPLHEAVLNNHHHIVQLLLTNKADVTKKDYEGLTVLHMATKLRDEFLMFLLLSHGASCHAKTPLHYTPLHCSMLHNKPELARTLLELNPEQSLMPIHRACLDGDILRVAQLLENNQLVNEQDECGWTPLHYAALMGHRDLAYMLLTTYNANPNIGGYADKRTPLHVATLAQQKEIIPLLLDRTHSDGFVDAQNYKKETALHIASRQYDPHIALMLLKNGASAISRSYNGTTPLHNAARLNNQVIAYALLQKGAQVDAANKRNKTPLSIATKSPSRQDTKQLLEDIQAIQLIDPTFVPPSNEDQPELSINTQLPQADIEGAIKPALSTRDDAAYYSGYFALFNALIQSKETDAQFHDNGPACVHFIRQALEMVKRSRGGACGKCAYPSAEELAQVRDAYCQHAPIIIIDKNQLLSLICCPNKHDGVFGKDLHSYKLLLKFIQSTDGKIAMVVKDASPNSSWFTIIADKKYNKISLAIYDSFFSVSKWSCEGIISSILPYYFAIAHPIDMWEVIFIHEFRRLLFDDNNFEKIIDWESDCEKIINTLVNRSFICSSILRNLIWHSYSSESISKHYKLCHNIVKRQLVRDIMFVSRALSMIELDDHAEDQHHIISEFNQQLLNIRVVLDQLLIGDATNEEDSCDMQNLLSQLNELLRTMRLTAAKIIVCQKMNQYQNDLNEPSNSTSLTTEILKSINDLKLLGVLSAAKYKTRNELVLVFWGPSGTGKTSLALAFAEHCCRKRILVPAACLATEYKDSGSANLRKAIDEFLSKHPDGVVIIDEFDRLADHGSDQAMANLWSTIDKYHQNPAFENAIFICITNKPFKDVPPQIQTRASNASFEVKAPDEKARQAAINYYYNVLTGSEEQQTPQKFSVTFDIKDLATFKQQLVSRTKDLSLRDIKHIFTGAMFYAQSNITLINLGRTDIPLKKTESWSMRLLKWFRQRELDLTAKSTDKNIIIKEDHVEKALRDVLFAAVQAKETKNGNCSNHQINFNLQASVFKAF